MAVAVVFQSPALTQEHYEEAVCRLTDGRKLHMESPSDCPVEGLLVNVAGQGESGFRVVDGWESQEAFERFGETLGSILQELGMQDRPEVYPALAVVK